MKFKIRKKWIIIIIIVLIIIGYFVIKSVFKDPLEGLAIEKIVKGDVVQEVFETGSVRAAQDISLSFKSVGRVANIRAEVGDTVRKGDILASLDSSQISAQLQAAQATLSYTISQYNSGIAVAEDNLQSAYNDAPNTLNDAYTKIYNAYNALVPIENSYFLSADQEGIRFSEAKRDINENMKKIKNYLDQTTPEAIDEATLQMATALSNVYNDLKIIRDQCEQGIYYSKVSSTDKTTIETQRGYINTAATSVTTLQNSISSYKIALQKSKDSTVEQNQANVVALQSQLNDSYLVSPIDGVVTSVNIKRGEVPSTTKSAINLLSLDPFQVKVNVYEQDIVNVRVGDSVKISLVAFPKQVFDGKVLLIDPAETIVDNVVYYEVTINFPNQPEGIRSGMTADITIETDKKDNVLRIPKNIITQIDGTEKVQIIKNGKVADQTITTGLEGNDYYEVLSGLVEGDQIVTGKK